MKYELEVITDSDIKIRKIMSVPLWNTNQIFDDIESLKKYLFDYVELPCSMNVALDLINSAAMNGWIDFQ